MQPASPCYCSTNRGRTSQQYCTFTILSDFLSRQNHNDSNTNEIIPISFNMHNLLHEKYYDIGKTEKYLVQTWSQTRSNGIKLSQVHGVSKFGS